MEEDFWAVPDQIQAEYISLIPLDKSAYLNVISDESVIQVVMMAKKEMTGSNVF